MSLGLLEGDGQFLEESLKIEKVVVCKREGTLKR